MAILRHHFTHRELTLVFDSSFEKSPAETEILVKHANAFIIWYTMIQSFTNCQYTRYRYVRCSGRILANVLLLHGEHFVCNEMYVRWKNWASIDVYSSVYCFVALFVWFINHFYWAIYVMAFGTCKIQFSMFLLAPPPLSLLSPHKDKCR